MGARRRVAEAIVRQAADVWSGGSDLDAVTVLSSFLHALSADVEFVSGSFDHGSTSPWSSNPLGNLPPRPLDAWKDLVATPNEE
jgi:hypothetical protein